MEKAKLTFMPYGNNTYAGFVGTDLVALIVPLDPEGRIGAPAWQWCARSECGPQERIGWAFPKQDRRLQREADLEDAMRRAAQYIGHGFVRPVGFCPDDCTDCPSVATLPPEEVDT